MHDLRSQQPPERSNDHVEEVLAAIPQSSGDILLEVVMMHDASGATTVELRSLVWGDGLGWYRQQTLGLDGTAARDLIQGLGIVQRRLEHQAVDNLMHKVLPLPRSHQQRVATA